MKKTLPLIIMTVMLLLTGCWNSMELEDRAIVSGIAVDRTKDGLYEVTCQLIKPGEIKNTGSVSSGPVRPVTAYTASANNIFEAINNIASQSGRQLFLSHSQILIIGEDAARQGIAEILDFYNRFPELRRRSFLAVTPGRAGEFMDMEVGMARIPAFGISNLIETAFVNSKSSAVRIQDFGPRIAQASIQPVASRVEIYREQNGKKRVKSSGTSVFKEHRLAGYLSEDETMGYQWIINPGNIRGIVSVPEGGNNGKRIVMEVLTADSRIKPEINNGQIKIAIKIKIMGFLAEVGDKEADVDNPETTALWEELLSEVVAGDVQKAVDKAKELDADIFGFGEKIRRKETEKWQQISPVWEDYFPDIEVAVEVKTNLRRTGKITKPASPRVSLIMGNYL